MMNNCELRDPGRDAGFTLIELMVVVAVLAILASIAYPLYTEQARKGRRVEGRDALLAIAQAEERYYTVNGAYTGAISNLGVSSVNCSVNPCISRDKGYYSLSVAATTSTFTATATPVAGGGQASDSCTGMTVNQLGVKGGTGTGCW